MVEVAQVKEGSALVVWIKSPLYCAFIYTRLILNVLRAMMLDHVHLVCRENKQILRISAVLAQTRPAA